MMKYKLLFAVLGIFLGGTDLSGMDVVRDCCVNFGKLIENSDVPVIGKLTNLLPVALVATSFKDYPGQTMILLTGLLTYILSRNESIREMVGKYKRICLTRLGIKENNNEVDETLFIFDGEDADDAEHEMEIEDDLLDDDSLSSDEDRNDHLKQKEITQRQQPTIKFL